MSLSAENPWEIMSPLPAAVPVARDAPTAVVRAGREPYLSLQATPRGSTYSGTRRCR